MKPLSGPTEKAFLGKLLYGLLFCIAIPAYLVFWSTRLELSGLPEIPAMPWIGAIPFSVGLFLIASGIAALWIHGRGLPMNPYPPTHYVQRGVFRWFSHPIYLGFFFSCVGISVAVGSSTGLAVISPIVALACAALVWGYEGPELNSRFGDEIRPPWFRLPPADGERPQWRDSISVVVLVFIPWFAFYEVVEIIGVVPPVIDSTLPFESSLPVLGLTVILYALVYPLVFLAPFWAGRQSDLRQFAIGGLVATALIIPFYLTIPFVAPFREIGPDVLFRNLLLLQQSFDTPVTALPAFHVVWIGLAIKLYCQRFPALRIALWAFGALMVVSCWTTGMHALLDVMAGIAAYVLVVKRDWLWRRALRFTEGVANSWKEWRYGSIRLINHGLYAGAAAAVGFFIVGYISDETTFWASFAVGVSIMLGAGIWGQIIVGSDKLLRPFGYYGAVLGAAIGILVVKLFLNQEIFPLAAALSVAAPWIQSIGRFRCLVQGCCHGAQTNGTAGICYHHERSRVTQIAGLNGKVLHPTPLYSILGNILVGLLTMRLLLVGAPASFLVGTYLMLNGLARFVEEAYRGEPQTPKFAGLKLYQWTALSSFLVGSAITMVPSSSLELHHFGFTMEVLAGSVAMGVLVVFAMGVDWPNSNRRFSRLI